MQRDTAITAPPYLGMKRHTRQDVPGSVSRFGSSDPTPYNPDARIGSGGHYDAPQEVVYSHQNARKHDRSLRHKPVWGRSNGLAVRCVETGEVFESIRDAAASMSEVADASHSIEKKISQAVKGGTAFGGYRWELVRE